MYLILTRRKGEKILVAETVITIEEIRGNRVKLSIEAPPEVPVQRAEVVERQKRAAA